MSLLAWITDGSTLEWLDLLGLMGILIGYLGLVLLWPPLSYPIWWLITHTIYRLRVYGREHIPRKGGALLISNHVSYVDWMLIWVACPRKIRFVAWKGHTKNILLKFVLRITRTILIDGQSGPKAIVASLRQISEALDRGEVVCVFPESTFTRSGNMLRFRPGFERVMKLTKHAIPIIPVYIHQLWGSIFSYRYGKLFWKIPERIPYPVALSFGEALPSTMTAPEVRLKIQELAADTAIRESDRSRPVHRHFVSVACRLRQLFKPCFIDTSTGTPRTISYAKALVGAICIRNWLKTKLGPEQNVGIWLPSSVGCAFANVAVAFLRKTSVNLNYTAGPDSILSAIKQTGLKHVITAKKFTARMPLEVPPDVQLIYLDEATREITSWQRITTFLGVIVLPGWFINRFWLNLTSHSVSDIATIIFSSGSTGEPKGVMLSHRNICSNSEGMVGHIDLTTNDRILGILPFFHSFGYTVTMWTPLQIGASAVYHPDPRQAKEIGELCRTHQCTILLATATFLRFYLRRCEPEDFKSLRLIVCGAEKLPPSLAKDFEAKFGILPLEGYGCTELAPAISVNVPDREIGGLKQVCNKIGSVGHPIPGVAARIADPDTNQTLPPGQEGLVWIKGPNVMIGYLNKPEMTAKVVQNGYYCTGDMGKVDEDGFITITGRLSRFAKIAGEMVPLEKIENDMQDLLQTGDRMLAVTSVPDEKRGERLMVLYLETIPRPIGEILQELDNQGMPNLWIPSERDCYLIPEMPVLGSGKIDLKRLKEVAMEIANR